MLKTNPNLQRSWMPRTRGHRAVSIWMSMLVLVLSAGCGGSVSQLARPSSAKSLPEGIVGDRTVYSATFIGQRRALVHHPASAAPGAPLVLVLHGEAGSAQQARDDYGWDLLADREGFVVAYPDGIGHSWNVSPTCCGSSHGARINDVSYLHQLLTELGKADLIGRSRVHAVGFSTGATMAYSWACAEQEDLAGIGAVAGSPPSECPNLDPITLAVVVGGSDPSTGVGNAVSPSSGEARGASPADGNGPHSPSLDATLAQFRVLDGCPDQPATITGPPVSRRSWSCAVGHAVSVAIIDGGGHQWPGAATPAPGGRRTPEPAVEPPSGALNATEWLWAHLRDARSR